MKNIRIKNKALSSEVKKRTAELMFEIQACQAGLKAFNVSEWNEPYDFIVLLQNKTYKKVQVKWVTFDPTTRTYFVSLRRGSNKKMRYTQDDFDILAAYSATMNQFILIPFGALSDTEFQKVPADDKETIGYINAWHLLV